MEETSKLMIEQLKDAYSAEKQALRGMQKMLRNATSPKLKEAIQTHIEQTQHQVERLDQAFQMVGAKAGRKVCEGMRGIIEEGQQEMEDADKGPMMDVLIVAAGQRVEHYEIASYGTMVALAKASGQQELADLLAETLAEEKETDELLTEIAETEVNPAFFGGGPRDDEEEDEEDDAEEDEEEDEESAAPARAATPPKPTNENRRGGTKRKAS
jgi:ferritin-like metal-binding protein YciE